MSDCLDNYLEGWRRGDPDTILAACADDFEIDDSVEGRFAKTEFGTYWQAQPDHPVEFSDVVTDDADGHQTQWGWWSQGSQSGAFLNRADSDGVHLTRVTYYAR